MADAQNDLQVHPSLAALADAHAVIRDYIRRLQAQIKDKDKEPS